MTDTRRRLSLKGSLLEHIFPTLTPTQINRIAAHGQMRVIQRGEVLIEQGDRNFPFFVLVTGEVEIVRPSDAAETLITIHGPGNFLGEANALSGRPSLSSERLSPSQVS